jgi:hypothetical protein
MILITLMMEAVWTSEMLVNFLHGGTTQKIAIFALTAVRTSNHTCCTGIPGAGFSLE